MSKTLVKEKKRSDFLREGIQSGYFQVAGSGALSLNLKKFLESSKGRERFAEIISSMPKTNKE